MKSPIRAVTTPGRQLIGGALAFVAALGVLLFAFSAFAIDDASRVAESSAVTHYSLPPELLPKAAALYSIHVRLHFFEALYGVAVLALLVRLRVAPRLRDFAERVTPRRFVQALLFVPPFLLAISLLTLPLAAVRHALQRDYGLSVQSWGSWLGDAGKGEMLQMVIAVPLVFGLYAAIRRSPKRWWLYGWLAIVPILVFMIFIAPVVVEPMFDTFEPLGKTHPELVTALGDVAKRGGLDVPADRMFLMKASEKVTTANAYVTGIGATKRIVVWDTTTAQMTVPQTQFVFGHELGHYVLGHIPKFLAFATVVLFFVFFLGARAVRAAVARWGDKLEIRGIGDWASLPLLFLFVSATALVIEPVFATASRAQEHEADVYGLEITHGLIENPSQAAAQAFQTLGEHSLSYPDPNPFFVAWTFDHPALRDRIDFALSYDPWKKGESPQFVR
ncbi:MAG: M48 family metallopeptidase [Polyangiaceae bacterium]